MTIAHPARPQSIYTEPEFRVRAAAALYHTPSESVFDPRTGRAWARSDWDLNPEMLADFEVMAPARAAAVLVPIIARTELTVLLTERTAHLSTHAGQIAFPGGKIDAGDASPMDAALREADEEVGLKREFIEPIGYLDVYGTAFGFRILPTVARVKPGFKLTINEYEVDDAFEVPLAFLMNPENHQIHTKEFRGIDRSYYAMPFAERYIWGATAGILRVLYERIYLR